MYETLTRNSAATCRTGTPPSTAARTRKRRSFEGRKKPLCRIGDLDIPRWREATGQDALRQVASVMSEPTARGSKLWLFR